MGRKLCELMEIERVVCTTVSINSTLDVFAESFHENGFHAIFSVNSPASECVRPHCVSILRAHHSVRMFAEGNPARCTKHLLICGVRLAEAIDHFQ